MSTFVAVLLVIAGIVLVLAAAGRLVTGVVATSRGFGLSAFLISVIFLGFDPENLAVGGAGAFEQVAGIALGSIIGAAMVALALALGITACIAPMTFGHVAKPVLAVPVAAAALFAVLAADGLLSRIDGALLLVGYGLAVLYLIGLARKGADIEAAVKPRQVKVESKWRAAGLMLLSLVVIVVGSEMAVEGSKTLIAQWGLSQTFFGMAILALAVSVEEVARELPAARRGHPEVTFGNVVGSVLAFFLFNGGVIALVRPVPVEPVVLRFYLPIAALTVLVITAFMLRRALPRWAGAILLALYIAFIAGGYLLGGGAS